MDKDEYLKESMEAKLSEIRKFNESLFFYISKYKGADDLTIREINYHLSTAIHSLATVVLLAPKNEEDKNEDK